MTWQIGDRKFVFGVSAGIALVGTPQGAVSGGIGTSISTSTGMNITGATLLVAAAQHWATANNGLITVSSTSNAAGNWHALTAYGDDQTGGITQLFYCYAPTIGTSETFTTKETGGTPDYFALSVVAFSGTQTTSGVYQASSDHGAKDSTGTATTLQPGSVTPSQTGALVISGFSSDSSTATPPTIDSSLTSVAYKHSTVLAGDGGIAYLIDSSTSAINPTWTMAAAQAVVTSIAVFLH